MVKIKHPHTGLKFTLHNQACLLGANTIDEKGIHYTLDVKQQENITGGTSGENPPPRQVLNLTHELIQPVCDENDKNVDQPRTFDNKATAVEATLALAEQTVDGEAKMHSNELGGEDKPPLREVIIDLEIDRQTYRADKTSFHWPDNLVHVHHVTTMGNNIYTRHTEPSKPEHIMQILSEISIGPDTMLEEHQEINKLITEFTDCFALAMSEVNTVPGAVHKLNILPEMKFHMRIPQ